MNIIACYPSSMSAWLSTLMTVPGTSLFAHDILSFPGPMESFRQLNYLHKGVVDTATTLGKLPADRERLIVIENSREGVIAGEERMGIPVEHQQEIYEVLRQRMEEIKTQADLILHKSGMDDWIHDLWRLCLPTIPFDPIYYGSMKEMHITSQMRERMRDAQIWG